jgi:hypothetical protein
MEQFMSEIRSYAAARGIKPGTVLQRGADLGGKVWATWEAGTATCTLTTADRIRAYMAANPPAPSHDAASAAPQEDAA